MHKALAELFHHSAIYGLGRAINAIGGLLLIPLYAHILSTSDFGSLELLSRLADILILIIFLGCRQGYIRFYFDRESEDWHKAVSGTMLIFVLISSTCICVGMYSTRNVFLEGLLQGTVTDSVFLLMLLWIPLEMLRNLGMSYLQIRLKSMLYIQINFLGVIVFLVLNVWFVYFERLGIAGIFYSRIAVTGLIAFGFAVYFARWTRFDFSLDVFKDLVKFGLPLVPASLFMYVIANSDRYFLGIYSSLSELGVYSLGYKIGMIGSMVVVDPFLKIWSPFLFKYYRQPDGPVLIGRVFTLLGLIAITFGLSISLMAPLVVPLISSSGYHGAAVYVPIICIGSIFYALHHIADAGILVSKKTHHKPTIFGLAASVAIIGNALLVPRIGAMGAAITISLSYLTLLLITARVSFRYYRFSVESNKLIAMSLSAAASYGIAVCFLKVLPAYSNVTLIISPLLALAAYPVLLFASGCITVSELKGAIKLIRRQ